MQLAANLDRCGWLRIKGINVSDSTSHPKQDHRIGSLPAGQRRLAWLSSRQQLRCWHCRSCDTQGPHTKKIATRKNTRKGRSSLVCWSTCHTTSYYRDELWLNYQPFPDLQQVNFAIEKNGGSVWESNPPTARFTYGSTVLKTVATTRCTNTSPSDILAPAKTDHTGQRHETRIVEKTPYD